MGVINLHFAVGYISVVRILEASVFFSVILNIHLFPKVRELCEFVPLQWKFNFKTTVSYDEPLYIDQ